MCEETVSQKNKAKVHRKNVKLEVQRIENVKTQMCEALEVNEITTRT
jgi:hypothetical protein